MKIRRSVSVILALLLALAIFPQTGMTAFADSGDPAIVEGTGVLAKNVNGEKGAIQILHYGGASWYVIGHNGTGNSVSAKSGVATLLQEGVGENVKFNADHQKYNANAYGGSDLQKHIDTTVWGKFDDKEKEAISARTLQGGSGNYGSTEYDKIKIKGSDVTAFLWPLSVAETEKLPDSIRAVGSGIDWWLRTPGLYDDRGAFVGGDGYLYSSGYNVANSYSVRPAFDLNLQSVIFTSAASGGKSSGTVIGADALNQIGTNSGNEWKVTVKEETHAKFDIVSCDTGYDRATGVATVSYKDAQTGNGEYISAVIKNKQGTITYYGRIAALDSAAGSVTINTKEKLNDGDELYVFNEQYHSDAATDYSSELKGIPLQPAPGHDLAKTAAKEATCTEAGNSEYWTCEKCGKFFDDDAGAIEIAKDSWIIPAGHKMNFCKEVPATCTEAGTKAYYECGRCEKKFNDINGTDELDDIVIPAQGHKMKHHKAVAATCTDDGTVEYWACENCNKNFSDELGTNELTTIVDPKTGHDYGQWEKLDDAQHRRVCSHDKTHVVKENHKWDGGKVQTRDGKSVTVYTCTVCNATKEVENKKETYQLSSGANGTWTKGSTTSLKFTFKNTEDDSDTFDHFTGIKVDGKDVPEKDASGKTNWTKKKGSVVIELQPAYLEKLSVGKHKLTASFDNGDDVTGEFTVKAKASTPTKSNKTKKSTSPKTGDESNMLLWCILICASLFVMMPIISLKGRRKKR